MLTIAGIALGTPSYMSPEQARGALAEIDERSDVFSLGAILFEVLTGRVPFEGANPEQVIAKAAAGRLPPVRAVCPEVPPELAAIADRAVQRAPKNRYPSADALARELLAYRTGGKVAAYEYGSWELVKKFVGRHRALSAVSAAALLVLVTSAVVIASQLRVARLNLATSFLERARAAEQASDWGRAAGYYAASRLEHDTREARWGYALARQRLPHRVVARNGPNQSAIDVGFTPDGQAIVLANEPPWLIGRELESGREQWRLQSPAPIIDAHLFFGGLLRLWSTDRMLYFDGPTGRLVETFDRADGIPCPWGPPTRRVLLANGLVTATGPGTVTVSWKAGPRPVCAVSSDGSQLALHDLDGVVHLWSLTEGKELASRHAPDTSDFLFTAHGLAAVRGENVQVFGGSEGDFSIVIPGRAGARGLGASRWATNVASPDGHLLAIARRSSSQADLVDLRTRTVFSSVSYAAGMPRFAFSPSGERLLVGGLLSQSGVAGWDIRSSNTSPPIQGAPIMGFYASQDGSRFVVFLVDPKRPRYELRTDGGTLLRAGSVGPALAVALSPDGHRIAVSDDRGAAVLDAESGETLWRVDCDTCRRLVLSGDGSLLLTSNGKRMDLWKAGGGKPIWSETERAGPIDGPLHLTRDGRRLLWGKDRSIYVHTVGQANDAELALDDPVVTGKFSYDGRRLAVATVSMLGAWEVEGLKALWRVRNPSWVFPEVYWSGDDSTLLIQYVAQGTTLRDSATGDVFATLGLSKPAAFEGQERVLPSLRYRISSGDGSGSSVPSRSRIPRLPGRACHGFCPRQGSSCAGQSSSTRRQGSAGAYGQAGESRRRTDRRTSALSCRAPTSARRAATSLCSASICFSCASSVGVELATGATSRQQLHRRRIPTGSRRSWPARSAPARCSFGHREAPAARWCMHALAPIDGACGLDPLRWITSKVAVRDPPNHVGQKIPSPRRQDARDDGLEAKKPYERAWGDSGNTRNSDESVQRPTATLPAQERLPSGVKVLTTSYIPGSNVAIASACCRYGKGAGSARMAS